MRAGGRFAAVLVVDVLVDVLRGRVPVLDPELLRLLPRLLLEDSRDANRQLDPVWRRLDIEEDVGGDCGADGDGG